MNMWVSYAEMVFEFREECVDELAREVEKNNFYTNTKKKGTINMLLSSLKKFLEKLVGRPRAQRPLSMSLLTPYDV
jgi:hypothetical protein